MTAFFLTAGYQSFLKNLQRTDSYTHKIPETDRQYTRKQTFVILDTIIETTGEQSEQDLKEFLGTIQ